MSDSDEEGLPIVLQPGDVSNPLLTPALASFLYEFLPAEVRIEGMVEWVLHYTPKSHGTSLETLYRRAVSDRSLLIIQDAEGHIFGGYTPEAWSNRTKLSSKFYGSDEAFLFAFGKVGEDSLALRPTVYPPTQENKCIMFSDDEGIGMGGGDGKFGLYISSDFLRGWSQPSATFGNPTLAHASEFVVKDFEIWGFVDT